MFTLQSRDRLLYCRSIRRTPLALGLMAMFLVACQANNPMNTGTEKPELVASSEAIERMEQLMGNMITLQVEPVAQVSAHSFTIQTDSVFGKEPILAINASGVPVIVPIDPQTPLEITGKMVRLIAMDIERAYGFKLDPTLYAEYEGKPAMIAESITFSPEPEEVTQHPTRSYNPLLAVSETVARNVATHDWTLDGDASGGMGGNNLLAIGPNSPPAQPGQTLLAIGVVPPVVREQLQEKLPLTGDVNLTAQRAAEYIDPPLLIIDHIYSSAIAP